MLNQCCVDSTLRTGVRTAIGFLSSLTWRTVLYPDDQLDSWAPDTDLRVAGEVVQFEVAHGLQLKISGTAKHFHSLAGNGEWLLKASNLYQAICLQEETQVIR